MSLLSRYVPPTGSVQARAPPLPASGPWPRIGRRQPEPGPQDGRPPATQALIQVAATAGYTIFPPMVALIAQSSATLGIEVFLHLAAACAAADLLLVILIQRFGVMLKATASGSKAAAAPTGAADNAASAQLWIDACRMPKADASSKAAATPTSAADTNAAAAQLWIDAWKLSVAA